MLTWMRSQPIRDYNIDSTFENHLSVCPPSSASSTLVRVLLITRGLVVVLMEDSAIVTAVFTGVSSLAVLAELSFVEGPSAKNWKILKLSPASALSLGVVKARMGS